MVDFTGKNFKKWETDAATVGQILGLTSRRVTQLVADGVIKRSTRGKYSVAAAVAGYIKWLQAAQQRNAPSEARERLIEARARSIELQNEEREHRLIDTDEAIAALDEFVGIFSTELDGLPADLRAIWRRERPCGKRSTLSAIARRTNSHSDRQSCEPMAR